MCREGSFVLFLEKEGGEGGLGVTGLLEASAWFLPLHPYASCKWDSLLSPPGSQEERDAFTRANHLNKLATKEETGVAMRIRVAQSMSMGSDFEVFAYINNDTAEERTCRLVLCARTVSYNGVLGPECGTKDLLNLILEPFSGKAQCP